MSRKSKLVDSTKFPRVTTRVTLIAKKRLLLAVEERQQDSLYHVSEGEILSEVVMQHLPPHPDEVADHDASKKPAAKAVRRSA
jgi:hypothetical protein